MRGFLRPACLEVARTGFLNEGISHADLTAVEDDCVRDLVTKQTEHGLRVIADGEFRRSYWHLDFTWGLNGIERRAAVPRTSTWCSDLVTTRRPGLEDSGAVTRSVRHHGTYHSSALPFFSVRVRLSEEGSILTENDERQRSTLSRTSHMRSGRTARARLAISGLNPRWPVVPSASVPT